MTAEQRFFLQVLSDYIHGRATEPPAGRLDWGRVLTFAQIHGLTGVTWLQCREHLGEDPEVLARLHGGFFSDVFHFVCRNRDFQEVSAAFAEAGIPFLPMKGTLLCRYHPVPQLRSMGDIDLVIRPQDRRRAHEIMTGLGFSCIVDNHAVWTYKRDVITYEVHDHMMYEHLANEMDYRGYFDHVWDYAVPLEGTCYGLDPSFHFLYLMAHTAKHMVNKGSGFRPFVDMVLMTRREALDWPWITAQLKRLRLLDFTRICFALCRVWFQVDMPLPAAKLDGAFYEQATRKAFLDGIFGLDNRENQTGASAKAIKRSCLPYWLTALCVTMKKLFPPYRDMQLIPWYSFVDGRPWLLPGAWLYRFYYCARYKKRHGKSLLEEPFIHRREIEARERFMRQWGL